MAVTQVSPYSTTITSTTTELSLVGSGATKAAEPGSQADATAGVYSSLWDISAVQPGDVFEIRIYEKVLSGGTQRVLAKWVVSAQGTDNAILPTPPLMLMQGWDFTIKRTAGATNRAIPVSIRRAS